MTEIRKLNPDQPENESEVDALRAEVRGLTTLVRNVLAERETVPQAPLKELPPLEPVESERDRILAAWAAEPRVAIFITPDENDKRARDDLVARKLPPSFPPRIFQVNGVQLAVPVGKSATVPESIAALYEYMLNPWEAQHKLPPITFEQAEAQLAVG